MCLLRGFVCDNRREMETNFGSPLHNLIAVGLITACVGYPYGLLFVELVRMIKIMRSPVRTHAAILSTVENAGGMGSYTYEYQAHNSPTLLKKTVSGSQLKKLGHDSEHPQSVEVTYELANPKNSYLSELMADTYQKLVVAFVVMTPISIYVLWFVCRRISYLFTTFNV